MVGNEVLADSSWFQADMPALVSMPAARRAFILAINRHGEARAEDLAKDMLLSLSAVRAQLITLAQDGLVTFRRVRAGRGRPKHLFRLTPTAEALLPNRYREILISLLLTLETQSPPVLDAVFEQVAAQFSLPPSSAERILSLPPEERVKEVTPLIERLGFQASCTFDGGMAQVVLHHCPLLAITSRYGQPCEAELRWYSSVFPEALVERTAHRPSGDSACAFVVSIPTRV